MQTTDWAQLCELQRFFSAARCLRDSIRGESKIPEFQNTKILVFIENTFSSAPLSICHGIKIFVCLYSKSRNLYEQTETSSIPFCPFHCPDFEQYEGKDIGSRPVPVDYRVDLDGISIN